MYAYAIYMYVCMYSSVFELVVFVNRIVNWFTGQPDAMIVCHLPYGPTAYFTLSSCVLRHDIPGMYVCMYCTLFLKPAMYYSYCISITYIHTPAECTPASQAYPHLILDGLNSKTGKCSHIL